MRARGLCEETKGASSPRAKSGAANLPGDIFIRCEKGGILPTTEVSAIAKVGCGASE